MNVQSVINDINNFDFDAAAALRYLYKICYKYHVKLNYEIENPVAGPKFENIGPNSKVHRVVLSAISGKYDANVEFANECNGLVLAFVDNKLKVVCRPQMVLNHFAETKKVKKLHAEGCYTITKIRDGTVVNLYHYDGKWRMGSASGYEVDGYRWMGGKTFREAFDLLCEKHCPDLLSKLDTAQTYTVGFRFHEFHPYLQDPEAVWGVSANCKGLGIPSLQTVQLSVEDILTICHSDTTEYGFILRGDFDKCVNCCSVVYESKFMQDMRRLIYNVPKEVALDETNRLFYMLLSGYLSYRDMGFIMSKFPQHQSLYDEWGKFISMVVKRIDAMNRDRNIKIRPGNKVDHLAGYFLEKINMELRFNRNDPKFHSVVYQYVHKKRFTNVFFEALLPE